MSLSSSPTDEELAAIVAAVALCWPEPAPEIPPLVEVTNRWRFSGRWWSRRAPAPRYRPWGR